MHNWKELLRLVNGRSFTVRNIRIPSEEIEIQGDFAPPPLARLPMEDQVFVAAFISSHGSIKKMEELFGISYPSVKNRLNRLAKALDFATVRIEQKSAPLSSDGKNKKAVLDLLEKGEITVSAALEKLK